MIFCPVCRQKVSETIWPEHVINCHLANGTESTSVLQNFNPFAQQLEQRPWRVLDIGEILDFYEITIASKSITAIISDATELLIRIHNEAVGRYFGIHKDMREECKAAVDIIIKYLPRVQRDLKTSTLTNLIQLRDFADFGYCGLEVLAPRDPANDYSPDPRIAQIAHDELATRGIL